MQNTYKKLFFFQIKNDASFDEYASKILNRVVPFSTPRCSSYWKGNLRVTLDYGRQLYLLITFV